ncbi:MAG: YqiA/YcfP family alpha/beta fold hydrolase, partial [Oceanobacter sp.]
LHGFLSSPDSKKAQETLNYYLRFEQADRIVIPALPFEPRAAIALATAQLENLFCKFGSALVIGSSLGGFYATHLVETIGGDGVVINPAVNPHLLFKHYIGSNRHYYTGEVHQLEERHLNQLAQISHARISKPENLLVMLQTGDQTLDFRHAEKLYKNCNCIIEEGGSHTFDGYKDWLPEILMFNFSSK